MIALLCYILAVLTASFKSRSRLKAENAALRQQLIVLRRKMHGRIRLTNNDRRFFVQLYRWFTSILTVLTVIRLETLVRWRRAGCLKNKLWKSMRQLSVDVVACPNCIILECAVPQNDFPANRRVHDPALKNPILID